MPYLILILIIDFIIFTVNKLSDGYKKRTTFSR